MKSVRIAMALMTVCALTWGIGLAAADKPDKVTCTNTKSEKTMELPAQAAEKLAEKNPNVECDGEEPRDGDPIETDPSLIDADGDGYTADVDCDDENMYIHPGRTDYGRTGYYEPFSGQWQWAGFIGDGRDNDCDGRIDDETYVYD